MRTNGFRAALCISLFGLIALCADAAYAYEVEGFRSARFGQKETEVTAAIAKDLGVKKTDIVHKENDEMGVTVLSARLSKFEPLDIPATISYVLGYKCRCLVQVTIVWDFPEKENENLRRMAMRGIGALAGKFIGEKWGENETAVNRLPKEAKIGDKSALVFFRGQNSEGGAITLMGAPVLIEKSKEPNKTDPVANVDHLKSVSLVYEQNAANPDVHRVDVSGF